MKKKLYVVWLVLGLVTIAAFQNCSSSLPNVDEQSSAKSVEVTYAPLTLNIINSSMAVGSLQTVYALGGKTPYTYSVPGGGCTIGSDGTLTAGSVANTSCSVMVTDDRGKTDTKPVNLIPASTGTVVTDPVVVKPTIFEFTSQTQVFVVPAYNTLKVEVWGGGGAGGGGLYAVTSSFTNAGASSVTATGVSVSASGGGNGTGGSTVGLGPWPDGSPGFPGSGNSGAGSPGTLDGGGKGGGTGGGAGSVSPTYGGYPTAKAFVPGGGGGGYKAASRSGGGGGGGYSVQTFKLSNGGPAKNTNLTVVVGAGGTSPASEFSNGAHGRVIISVVD